MTRFLHLLTSSGAFGLAWYSQAALASAAGLYVSAVFATGGVIVLLFALFPKNAEKIIVRLGGVTWNRRDWLITGDTGTGKTKRALNSLMYQIFENEPNWLGTVRWHAAGLPADPRENRPLRPRGAAT